MSYTLGVGTVMQNIANAVWVKQRAKLTALNMYYATLVINYFNQVQPSGINRSGKFWTNRSGQAAVRMFANAFESQYELGFFIAHGVDYGIWLTLANDRKHDALTPCIQRFVGRYLRDVQKIFSDEVF